MELDAYWKDCIVILCKGKVFKKRQTRIRILAEIVQVEKRSVKMVKAAVELCSTEFNGNFHHFSVKLHVCFTRAGSLMEKSNYQTRL